MKSVVVGASAGLGRALAENLAEHGHELYLIASDEPDLQAIAADLRIRFGRPVAFRAIDLAEFDAAALAKDVQNAIGDPDNLLFIAGLSSPADRGPMQDELAARLMAVNFEAGVRLVNAFVPILADRPGGNIVGIGSVAAARGRRGNAVYGAAKRGLEFYFETQRHALARKPCRVQFYRAGYLKTQMTAGQKLLFPAADPADAAETIRRGLGRDIGMRYLPTWWWPICALLERLPWAIFKKLDF